MMNMHRPDNENQTKSPAMTSASAEEKYKPAVPLPSSHRGGATEEKTEPGYHMERYIEHVEVEETAATNGTRLIIVYIAAFLALLSLISFVITKDPRMLPGISVLAYPLYKIVDYYFGRPEDRR
ncbi:MAG TPA: hypothetical protein VKR06_39290 [Ktedonosporobacter sp.]|nr:hypothetical protein [Ktedonosporobacter sp.]